MLTVYEAALIITSRFKTCDRHHDRRAFPRRRRRGAPRKAPTIAPTGAPPAPDLGRFTPVDIVLAAHARSYARPVPRMPAPLT